MNFRSIESITKEAKYNKASNVKTTKHIPNVQPITNLVYDIIFKIGPQIVRFAGFHERMTLYAEITMADLLYM